MLHAFSQMADLSVILGACGVVLLKMPCSKSTMLQCSSHMCCVAFALHHAALNYKCLGIPILILINILQYFFLYLFSQPLIL